MQKRPFTPSNTQTETDTHTNTPVLCCLPAELCTVSRCLTASQCDSIAGSGCVRATKHEHANTHIPQRTRAHTFTECVPPKLQCEALLVTHGCCNVASTYPDHLLTNIAGSVCTHTRRPNQRRPSFGHPPLSTVIGFLGRYLLYPL
jgi:hypothetical protein